MTTLTNFRTSIAGANSSERLARRLNDGIRSDKYKPVDYDKLRAIAAEKKIKGQAALLKVHKLEQASKQSKEHSLLKQHHRVWNQEFLRLNSKRRQIQAELDLATRAGSMSEESEHLFNSLEDFETHLDGELMQFKKVSVQPIWDLREDLEYWLQNNRSVLKEDPGSLQNEHDDILQQVQAVKNQQISVIQQLVHEQISIEQELNLGDLPQLHPFGAASDRIVETGIPYEAFQLECPDEKLKADVLQEFILLDEKYTDGLADLITSHSDVLGSETGFWTEDEHYLFQVVIDQHPHDIPNRRKIYIDRLLRHMPHRTRSQIVDHENWWTKYKYYNERRKNLINSWIRDRTELLNRAYVLFSEYIATLEAQREKQELRKKQKELSLILYEKVYKWREQKLEAMKLEHQMAEARQRQLEKDQKEAEEKERGKRNRDKQKLKAYHDKMADEHKIKQLEYQQKLEKLNQLLAEQAEVDKERVQYRKDEEKKKVQEKHEKKLMKIKEEEEKEERLEQLREKVRPQGIEGDLLRVWKDTESWANRTRGHAEDVDINKPLFNVNSFASHKITMDPRVRLENRLRDAGVLNTDYARQAIQQMQPQHQQTRNMHSNNIFGQN